jgi:hypothetical protein
MDIVELKWRALSLAYETNERRFNVQEKPSAKELIEAARKFEAYLKEGSF